MVSISAVAILPASSIAGRYAITAFAARNGMVLSSSPDGPSDSWEESVGELARGVDSSRRHPGTSDSSHKVRVKEKSSPSSAILKAALARLRSFSPSWSSSLMVLAMPPFTFGLFPFSEAPGFVAWFTSPI